MTQKSITLPITGMSCANCAANITRTLEKLDGVDQAQVNFASENAQIRFNEKEISPPDLIAPIQELGFGVALAEMDLPVTGMSCVNCANNIQNTLNKSLDGVVEARVNFASEHLRIRYISAMVSLEDIQTTVQGLGFDLVPPDEDQDPSQAEEIARSREIKGQQNKFVWGALFALPLFFLSMGRDFGLVGNWSHATWVNWLFFALATPVQFYTGWDYYTGAYNNLKHKTANMD
ncbi:MAG: heavy metal translocating P-type ATPase, partial [Desulfobacterales bacterium]|nr:heavy metal translocating P-type ATPase [Desulfobacterales bacterium]